MTDPLLTDAHFRAILRHKPPRIPLEPDEAKALEPRTVTINQQVWVVVKGAKRDKKAGWYVDYEVHDYRPRLMRRNPSGGPHTHSVQLAVAQEDADVVPDEYQDQLTREAKYRRAEFDQKERPRLIASQRVRQFEKRLRRLAGEAAKYGVDITPQLVAMLREAEAAVAEKRVEQKDAA